MRVSGKFFKAVVQAVLIFGLETWMMTSRMRQDLRGLQNRVSQWIMLRQLRQRPESRWEYPPLGGVNAGGGLGGGRAIRTEEAEHGRSVHCGMTKSGNF